MLQEGALHAQIPTCKNDEDFWRAIVCPNDLAGNGEVRSGEEQSAT